MSFFCAEDFTQQPQGLKILCELTRAEKYVAASSTLGKIGVSRNFLARPQLQTAVYAVDGLEF